MVLLLGSAMLAPLIHARTPRLTNPQHLPPGHLPGRLDNYTLRFVYEAAPGGPPIPRAADQTGASHDRRVRESGTPA